MPRSIEVSTSPEKIDAVLGRIDGINGVLGVTRQRGISLNPPGDVLTIQATTDATRDVFRVLDDLRVTEEGSIQTSSPTALILGDKREHFERESNEGVWEEMEFLLREDTNLAFNFLALMFLAGAIAGVGLWTDTLHLIIGAMVIAPAFEPLVRLPFGLIIGPRSLSRRAALSAAAGYLMLAAGGFVSLLVLRLVDPGTSSDLEARGWVQYWSSFTAPGVLVSTFAAAAGAIVVCGLRSVLTTGVMIALALIPSVSVAGMALAVANFPLAGMALARWAVDAALVLLVSSVVLGCKQKRLHRRPVIE